MAKKNSLTVEYNAPVSLSLAIATLAVYLIDTLFFKGSLIAAAFTCHGNASSDIPFNFSSPLEYIRLFTHVLGSSSWESLFVSESVILLAGPQAEEQFGSPVLALMMSICTLVSGVLNACLIPQNLTGQAAIVFMLIFTSVILSLEKKQIQISWILIFVLLLAEQLHYGAVSFTTSTKLSENSFIAFMQKNVGTFTSLAAGITGSLFACLVAPKKPRPAKKSEPKEAEEQGWKKTRVYQAQGTTPPPMQTPYDRPNPYDGTVSQEEIDALNAQSPRFKNKKHRSKDEEIGTLSF